MKLLTKVLACASVCSALLYAESWTGKLVDASCVERKGEIAECAATANTISFSLALSDGKVVKLDAEGNAKAAEVVKTKAQGKKNFQAKVTGTMDGDIIKVESIDVN